MCYRILLNICDGAFAEIVSCFSEQHSVLHRGIASESLHTVCYHSNFAQCTLVGFTHIYLLSSVQIAVSKIRNKNYSFFHYLGENFCLKTNYEIIPCPCCGVIFVKISCYWKKKRLERKIFEPRFLLFVVIRSSHRRSSIKKLFFKISQYSQENTCEQTCEAGLRPITLFRNRFQRRCFPVVLREF